MKSNISLVNIDSSFQQIEYAIKMRSYIEKQLIDLTIFNPFIRKGASHLGMKNDLTAP
jgi:hypothetical protein